MNLRPPWWSAEEEVIWHSLCKGRRGAVEWRSSSLKRACLLDCLHGIDLPHTSSPRWQIRHGYPHLRLSWQLVDYYPPSPRSVRWYGRLEIFVNFSEANRPAEDCCDDVHIGTAGSGREGGRNACAFSRFAAVFLCSGCPNRETMKGVDRWRYTV